MPVTDTKLIVAGLGRCGSSLVMQMLDRIRINCAGDWPSFEHPGIFTSEGLLDLLMRHDAVKVLNPYEVSLPTGYSYRVLLLKRNVFQQTRSQYKLLARQRHPAAEHISRHRKKITEKIREQFAASFARLCEQAGPENVYRISFEELILHPRSVATDIVRHFRLAEGRDQIDMAGHMIEVVEKRRPACLPDLLEEKLIARGRPAVA